MNAEQIKFYDDYHAMAVSAGNDLKINPMIPLAQWALESGWGTASYVSATHNLAGIMKSPKMVMSFPSFQAFLGAYEKSMTNDCPVIKDGKADPNMTAQEIFKGTDYNTANPNYASTIQSIVDTLTAYEKSLNPTATVDTKPALATIGEIETLIAKLKGEL